MKIIGNSHVAALQGGLSVLPQNEAKSFEILGANAAFEVAQFFQATSDGLAITDRSLAARVERLCGEPVIRPGIKWGFCFGHSGHILAGRDWRNYRLVDALVTGAKTQPISTAVLKAFVEHTFTHVLDFFDAASRSHIVFALILAPPTRRNAPAIANGHLSSIDAISIDRIGREVLRDKVAALGRAVIEPPPQSFDDEGFLRSEFCAGKRADGTDDPHHANAEYGKLMLRRITEKCGSMSASEDHRERATSELAQHQLIASGTR